MKMFLMFAAVLVPFLACSQGTNASVNAREQAFRAQAAQRLQLSSTPLLQLKPNETFLGKTPASGIAVEVGKVRNPLQLVNPFAPASYGQAEDNVVRDPISGRVSGLKLFAIKF